MYKSCQYWLILDIRIEFLSRSNSDCLLMCTKTFRRQGTFFCTKRDVGADFRALSRLTDTIIPVLWINQTVTMAASTQSAIYKKLVLVPRIARTGSYVAIAVGLLLLIIAAIGLIRLRNHRKRHSYRKSPTVGYGPCLCKYYV